ncbi:hypothetical protein NCC49_006324 [Naganishia albida]|nr:hypothetical protein NCC49_006324 [Naganishia albida]
MATFALFTLTCLLRSTRGIPVPQAAVASSVASSAVAPGSTASTATGANDDAVGVAGIKSPAMDSAPDDELIATATSAASGSSSVPEATDPNVSQLNGMSTEQLAMYVGIGLATLVALGVAYYFFNRWQKKKKKGGNSATDGSRKKRSKYDSDDDTSDEDDSDSDSDDDDKPRAQAPSRPRDAPPLTTTAPYPPQPPYDHQTFYPPHPANNMAGAGAHGGYERTTRHANTMDVYPVDPSLGPARPPVASPPARAPRQKPVQRSLTPRDDDSDSDDESDSETEDERRRRVKREARKKAKKARV